MFDKVQRDRFWLVLGAILIALFEPRQTASARYDRSGMRSLVEKTIGIPTAPPAAARPRYRTASLSEDPYAGLVTGSIFSSAPRPLARPGQAALLTVAPLAALPSGRYYVQLGSYGSIDNASRRYFDILAREPDLKGSERVSIDTARVAGEEFHRVRMGPFASEASAKAACARAAVRADECAVVALE